MAKKVLLTEFRRIWYRNLFKKNFSLFNFTYILNLILDKKKSEALWFQILYIFVGYWWHFLMFINSPDDFQTQFTNSQFLVIFRIIFVGYWGHFLLVHLSWHSPDDSRTHFWSDQVINFWTSFLGIILEFWTYFNK